MEPSVYLVRAEGGMSMCAWAQLGAHYVISPQSRGMCHAHLENVCVRLQSVQQHVNTRVMGV
eukprot:scaffold7312_cov21-Tisochrysis_lutea.AAC.3